jgi:peptidyl-Asp metalloendopeptidase
MRQFDGALGRRGVLLLLIGLMAAVGGVARAQSAGFLSLIPDTEATSIQADQLARERQAPMTESSHLARVNLDALQAPSTDFNFGDGQTVSAVRRSLNKRSDQDFSWSGDVPGGGNANLVVRGNEVTGSIRRGGDLFRIVPLGDGVHAVVKVDQAKFPPEHPPGSRQ